MASKRDKCIHLMVTTDLSQREIAKQIDVAEETISRWKKKENWKKDYQEACKSVFGDLEAKAIKTLENNLKARSEFVRQSSAEFILDRLGYKPTDKVEVDTNMVVIKDDI